MNLETSLKRGPFSEVQVSHLNEVLPALDSEQLLWLNGYLAGLGVAVSKRDTPSETDVSLSNISVSPTSISVKNSEPIWVLYGTHTGNCETLAKESAKRVKDIGREAKVLDMESFKTKTLKEIKELLIIVSTDGEGEAPLQAQGLLSFLQGKRAPKLDHLSYSVLALGDSSYAQFCQTGKDFDEALQKNGAKRLKDRVDCDVDFEDLYEEWISEVIPQFVTQLNIGEQVSIHPATTGIQSSGTVYNRKNPFPATILEKINLNGRGSTKETIHLELDLAGSDLKYEPGDALGIYGLNNTHLVDDILAHLRFTGDETVETHKGPKNLREALIEDYELTILTVPTLKQFTELTGSKKIKEITEDKDALTAYLYGRDVLDLLREEEFGFTPQDFLSILRKNMPRMYSIASSQKEVEEEVHLLISSVRYEAYGRKKEGICSTYLADQLQEGDQVKVFVDPNTRFRLPEDTDRPIIMIGPGTGVAPFRSFLQDRYAQDATGKSWLFFGDRNFTTDFLYQSEWLRYIKDGALTRADVAFSRDQKEKVYVQDRMIEKGKDLFEWLEEGAHLYVCGDKDHMAKDVDHTLVKIVQSYGNMAEEQASNYVKNLRKSMRYQVDVY